MPRAIGRLVYLLRRCGAERINGFSECNYSPVQLRNCSQRDLWQSTGTWGFGRDAHLQYFAVFQFCPRRHDGLWRNSDHSGHVVFSGQRYRFGAIANRSVGTAVRYSRLRCAGTAYRSPGLSILSRPKSQAGYFGDRLNGGDVHHERFGPVYSGSGKPHNYRW